MKQGDTISIEIAPAAEARKSAPALPANVKAATVCRAYDHVTQTPVYVVKSDDEGQPELDAKGKIQLVLGPDKRPVVERFEETRTPVVDLLVLVSADDSKRGPSGEDVARGFMHLTGVKWPSS